MLTDETKAFERFLDEQVWNESTIKFYRYILGRLISWMESNQIDSFAALEIRQVKEFITACKWGNSMTRKLQSVLSQFILWKYGQDHQLLRWKVRREVAPPQRTLDQPRAEKLLATFQPGIAEGYSNRGRRFTLCDLHYPLGIRNRSIVWLMLDTGLRSNEICNLELGRLNLAERTITARVKFGKWRTAIFTKRTAAALSTWLAVREQFATPKSRDRIFIGVMNGFEGVPLMNAGLRSMFRKLGIQSGIGPLSPHDLRRSFATLSIRAGASIQAVKEAGGWSNSEMVMHYTRAIKASEVAPFLPGNVLEEKELPPQEGFTAWKNPKRTVKG